MTDANTGLTAAAPVAVMLKVESCSRNRIKVRIGEAETT